MKTLPIELEDTEPKIILTGKDFEKDGEFTFKNGPVKWMSWKIVPTETDGPTWG
jgi:hypothetical protein